MCIRDRVRVRVRVRLGLGRCGLKRTEPECVMPYTVTPLGQSMVVSATPKWPDLVRRWVRVRVGLAVRIKIRVRVRLTARVRVRSTSRARVWVRVRVRVRVRAGRQAAPVRVQRVEHALVLAEDLVRVRGCGLARVHGGSGPRPGPRSGPALAGLSRVRVRVRAC